MSNFVLESPFAIHTSLQKSISQNAFAESEDENVEHDDENEEYEDGDETNDEDAEDEIEDEDIEEDGDEIETEDEIEDEDIEDEDIEEIEDDNEIETEDEIEETEIEVKITNDKTKVKIEQNGVKSKFLLETIDEKEALKVISQKTGLSESQVQNVWDLEIESDSDESDAKTIQRKDEAVQDAQTKIAALESHISELEQRVQALLEKLQSGRYYGNMESQDQITKSFNISFDGSAVSLQDESEDILSGEIFLDTKYTGQNISIMRITGGEIIIGDTYYDMMFGKARISSSGPTVKDTMILVGQVMDQEGNLNTIRLSINAELPMDVDSGQKPISIQIDAPSKIAKQWSLKAAGTFSES